MSAEVDSNLESRVRRLEQGYNGLLAWVRQLAKQVADALQKALTAGQGQGGGSSGSILLAFTPAGGIGFATFTGTGASLVITPGSATCWIYRVQGGTTTFVNQSTVRNFYTSSTSTNVGASKLIVVAQDESGQLFVVGEPC